MAIDALTSTTPDPGRPGRSVVHHVCACGSQYVTTGTPDPHLLGPWVAAHLVHDPGLPVRTGVAR